MADVQRELSEALKVFGSFSPIIRIAIADTLLPVVERIVREAKAEALRDAADATRLTAATVIAWPDGTPRGPSWSEERAAFRSLLAPRDDAAAGGEG